MKRFLFILFILLVPIIVNAEKIKEDFTFNTRSIKSDFVIGKDGNYYITGQVSFMVAGVQKYSSSHELITSKTLSNYKYCFSIEMDEDENLYTVCQKQYVYPGIGDDYYDNSHNSYYRLVLVKLDKDLNTLFEKDFLNEYDKANDGLLKRIGDSIYYIDSEKIYDRVLYEEGTKRYINYKFNYFITKFNADGEIISRKKVLDEDIDMTEFFYIQQDIVSSQNGFNPRYNIEQRGEYLYFVVGYRERNVVAKYKIDGDIVWSKEFLFNEMTTVRNITFTNDNKIIVVGDKIRENPYNGKPSITILNADTGEIIESKYLDGVNNSYVLYNADGGYYAYYYLAANSPFGNETSDYYLVKYDYNFNVRDILKVGKDYMVGKVDSNGIHLLSKDIGHYSSDYSADNYAEKEMYITDKLSIKDIFEDVNVTDWSVDDLSIIKVEDNIIIPKALGETYLSTKDGNTVYRIKIKVLEVPEEEKEESNKENPNTIDIIKMILIMMISSLLILVLSFILFKHKKTVS